VLAHRLRDDRLQVLGLLVGAALLFAWDLDVSGYANSYYSAAALAGSESWKAMFFGSLDSANAITVDKPPFALWPMVLSIRAFGMAPWSVLLPQAIEGVASVGLLYACVRRATNASLPALVAGAVFALTPVAVLMFRYNNPDAMLTLLLLGAAHVTPRAVDSQRAGWWLVLAGTLMGLGFLTKMLEAFLVLPALVVTYLVHGRGGSAKGGEPARWRRRARACGRVVGRRGRAVADVSTPVGEIRPEPRCRVGSGRAPGSARPRPPPDDP
jgi:4-amino-4-deoxy-L-arabinose transferase-like glycosyltransferase